ncbi:DUF899 family protein [Notoacmeibacter sp. MSK16QG-6]|uniref:DUF899 family protein n=1 Tax=Notoacmeibacter sp. MSK16QG-6 TaxID=2957982 RepID=UPI0020A18364|nr:DUF899 family protein [Notoacmeibacter sp. MSK16QG-6]MCP1198831.1 DUF899 domain-containing protein [Notoacmeibacter sp. MSK16QG-6]
MSQGLKPAADIAHRRTPQFSGESAEYATARQALLAEEIDFRRHMTRLSEQRMALPPGPVIEKDYRFRTEGGKEVGLKDLFGEHDTLVSYFWMYGPERERPCPMCTNWLGGVDGNAKDIEQRVALKIFGRSPVARQKAFAEERGWRGLDFVQTVGDDYANDLGLINDDGSENPALTVYRKDGDRVRLFLGRRSAGSRSAAGPSHGARYRSALVDPRPYAGRARNRLVSETGILNLTFTEQDNAADDLSLL